MTGSGLVTLSDVREVHPDVREVIPDVREWLGDLPDVWGWSVDPNGCARGPPRCPGVVGRPPGNPGVVGRPARMSRIGREALSYVREWSGGPPKCLEMVESPYRMS